MKYPQGLVVPIRCAIVFTFPDYFHFIPNAIIHFLDLATDDVFR